MHQPVDDLNFFHIFLDPNQVVSSQSWMAVIPLARPSLEPQVDCDRPTDSHGFFTEKHHDDPRSGTGKTATFVWSTQRGEGMFFPRNLLGLGEMMRKFASFG